MELQGPRNLEGTRMLEPHVIPLEPAVVSTDKTFYAALGQRLAERQKTLGLTQ